MRYTGTVGDYFDFARLQKEVSWLITRNNIDFIWYGKIDI
jgi:hypothetical protein